jgi:hypothetical protein
LFGVLTTSLERSIRGIQLLCEKHRRKFYVAPHFPKKRRLGPQNGSRNFKTRKTAKNSKLPKLPEKVLIEWKGLKLRGKIVQEYIDEFRKMALMLDIPLHTQETLMNSIRGLPAHIRNIVFMFGPTNLDEVFVQETYIEARKTVVGVSGESSSRKEDKRKGNGKKSNSVTRRE